MLPPNTKSDNYKYFLKIVNGSKKIILQLLNGWNRTPYTRYTLARSSLMSLTTPRVYKDAFKWTHLNW